MKRFFLLGFASISILSLSAQYPIVRSEHVSPVRNIQDSNPAVRPLLPSGLQTAKLVQSPNAVSVSYIGTSVSAYGLSGNARTCLWADNTTNSVAFFHRLNGNESQGSSLGLDFSKDGGQTWSNNILVYSPTGPPVPPQTYSQSAGRYPQGAIFNPAGNTNPDNVYAHYFAPALDNSNIFAPGGWGGLGFGVIRADSLISPTQHNMSSNTFFSHAVPSAFTLQDSLAFMVEPLYPGSEFTDTMIMARGQWNNSTGDFSYTRQKINIPTDWKVTDSRIAFSPDGYSGYISVISHNSSKPLKDSTYFPIIYRTSNGGLTWSGPNNISLYGLNGIPEVKNYLTDGDLNFLFGYVPDRDSLLFTTVGDHDLVVDMNGNPHIGVVISLAQGSYQTYVPSTCVVFDLYSLDGGNTWHAAPLESIYNVWGKFGSGATTITEDNRVQLSRSVDGSKVFVSWIDTHPAASPSNNTSPDIYAVGLNIDNLMKTGVFNVTAGTAAAGAAYMAAQSHIVLGDNGQYVIPFVYQSMNTLNVNLPVQYKYINGFQIDDSQFITSFGNTLVTQLKSNINICLGALTLPVNVINCNNVAAISLSLTYDDIMMHYIGYQNEHSLLAGGSLIINAMNQHIQISWYSLDPINIGNGILVELLFEVEPGSSYLNWDVATQAACEYTNINSDIIPASFINCHLTVVDCYIEGMVTYDNASSTPLSNTTLVAKQGSTIVSSDITNSQGVYAIDQLESGTYIISATTTKDWGGANSIDALTIQKYFAGFLPIVGMKLKAGDVNNSIGVNSVDALQISRRFVLLISSFAAGDWYFLKDTVTLDSTSAFVNLKGICYGDVNGSYTPLAKEGPPPSFRCSGTEKTNKTGLIEIPVRLGRDAEIASISYIMNYLPDQVSVKDVRMEAGGTLVYNVLADQVRISWFSLEPMMLQAGETLFTLLCESSLKDELVVPAFTLQPGTVFSNFEGEVLEDLLLNFPGITPDPQVMWLGANRPNPFQQESRFSYFIPEDAVVSLNIYSMLGECRYKQLIDGTPGIHEMSITADLLSPGMYYYEIEAKSITGTVKACRKMVVVR